MITKNLHVALFVSNFQYNTQEKNIGNFCSHNSQESVFPPSHARHCSTSTVVSHTTGSTLVVVDLCDIDTIVKSLIRTRAHAHTSVHTCAARDTSRYHPLWPIAMAW